MESGAIAVRLANYLAYIGFVRPRALFFQCVWRTEPDLDLIKQVEQVTRFGGIPSIGITGAVGGPVFREFRNFFLAVICLQKTATTAAGAERHLSAKGGPAVLP